MSESAQGSTSAEKRVPRIYVASLSDYNAGRLHGVWLEATDIEQVRDGVAGMLKASPGGDAEEYALHDFEGFSRYLPSEFVDLEFVCAIGAAIVEHGTVFTAYLELVAFPTTATSSRWSSRASCTSSRTADVERPVKSSNAFVMRRVLSLWSRAGHGRGGFRDG